MEVIGDIIQVFMPGCSQVRRILQARIPIIKFNHDYAGVECDLSMGSMYVKSFRIIDRQNIPKLFKFTLNCKKHISSQENFQDF